MLKKIRLLVATVFSLVVVLNVSTQANASSPFACRPGFYQVISGQLNILNPLTGQYSPIGNATAGTYNAIGYNPNDNYIYGWGTGGTILGQLIRVDSSGVVTALGSAGTNGSYVSGDFDDNNNLYFRKNGTTLVRINVAASPLTATELTLTGSPFEGVDMGWINGVMYSIDDATLHAVDLSTLVVTTSTIADVGSPSGKAFPSSGSYGAVFSNRADELYASNNGLGKIYRITDYSTNSPKATWVVDATVTSNNDGAACKQAPSPFDVPVAVDDTYSVTNDEVLTPNALTGIFANDASAGPTLVSNTTPSNGTLVVNSDGSFTYTPEPGFVGTVTFTYISQDQWGRVVAAATVTINVLAPASSTDSPVTTTSPSNNKVDELPNAGSSNWMSLLGATLFLAGLLTTKLVRREFN